MLVVACFFDVFSSFVRSDMIRDVAQLFETTRERGQVFFTQERARAFVTKASVTS